MDNKEEQVITLNMVKHTIGVFWSKTYRRLVAGGFLTVAGVIVLHSLPDLYGCSAGTLLALTLCRMLAWFSAITGVAVFSSNIRKFDLSRYIAAAVTCAVVLLLLMSARGVLSGIDLADEINSSLLFRWLCYEIIDKLPLFFAALTGSVLVGYAFGRKRV